MNYSKKFLMLILSLITTMCWGTKETLSRSCTTGDGVKASVEGDYMKFEHDGLQEEFFIGGEAASAVIYCTRKAVFVFAKRPDGLVVKVYPGAVLVFLPAAISRIDAVERIEDTLRLLDGDQKLVGILDIANPLETKLIKLVE